MNTGGPTGPAENIEAPRHQNQSGNTKMDQVRRMGKYCKDLSKTPTIQEKIKEFLQGRITKSQLEVLFKKEMQSLGDQAKKMLGIPDDTEEALDTFLSQNSFFEDQFLYEINRNFVLKETAQQEMLDACIETASEEYDLTDVQKDTLSHSLEKENNKTLVNFLEISKTRRVILKRTLKSDLTTKALDDIGFDSLHNKIANLPPGQQSRRIQDVWNTLTGGFKVRDGESIQGAFQRIQEEGIEGDLTADYEVFFGESNTLISPENKGRILDFLVRNYAATLSFAELQNIDQKAAQNLSSMDSHEVSSDIQASDAELREALLAFRHESALSERQKSLISTRIATRKLTPETQIRILGSIGSRRRLKELQAFHGGRPGGISSNSAVDFEDGFSDTYQFSPQEIAGDESLRERLQVQLGSKLRRIENFAPGGVMMWKTKTPDGKRDMVGYYAIERTLGEDDETPGDIKVRFLGTNQSQDQNNPLEKGKISRGGIPRTYTGPQFFDYLSGCVENGVIDFIDGGSDFSNSDFQKQLENDGVDFYTDEELHAELRHRYGGTEIQNENALNKDLDELLYEGDNKTRESDTESERNLYVGLVFAMQKGGELDTFEIEDILPPTDDGEPGMVHVWDGWGSGPDARREMTFKEFYNVIKQFKSDGKTVYRMPWGKSGERFGTEQFNTVMRSEAHAAEGQYKKNNKVLIRDGKLFEYDNSGTEKEKTIVQVGGGKDLHILSIDGNTVEVSQGTFKQTKWDSKEGKFTQKPEFIGTRPYRMPLTLLWSYLQKNKYTLTKEDTEKKFKDPKEDKGGMGWMNIFLHAHSIGTIMHGDLWKGPWKAFEEQHHKDHAFAGKITSALAMEKLQRVPGIGSALFDYDWANLMVGDANSTFQGYLDELVNKIDGMGSYHRTRMIKKWAKSEHFPSAKFMAAMFASMQIFGQLYPYDDGDTDPRKQEWFWFNSICHSLDPNHANPQKYPHMPPHGNESWPAAFLNKGGEPLSEVEACQMLFQGFKHPLLQNLGRRYQKYMNKGHDNLVDGGKQNLEQRTTMEEKLSWMMGSIVDGKPTEAFGGAMEMWLNEGYSTEISTLPYAAMMFGHRDQHLLPRSQEHLKDAFQTGNHIPMFVFAQNKRLGDIFRDTGIALAYTISESAGTELERLTNMSKERRLDGKTSKKFSKEFQIFWKKHGAELMHKLTGMKDPMLNLMFNAPDTFEEMLDELPPEKQSMYRRLREKKGPLQAYYDRLKSTYDSPQHTEMPRNKGFYSGDHFRFRPGFDAGYPMAWIDWDSYLDANLDEGYASGGKPTSGDGIFNEIRAFLQAIPDMAEKMTKQMGFTGQKQKDFIHKISQKLYDKNIGPMRRLAEKKIKATNPDAEYCSMTAMMFGMVPIQKLAAPGSDIEAQNRYNDYFDKMKEIKNRADEMQKYDCPKAIKYRENAADMWSKIVKGQLDTRGMTIEQILQGEIGKPKQKSIVESVTDQTLENFENVVRFPKMKNGKRGEDDDTLSGQQQIFDKAA